ncbi:transmembrane protein 183B-like isoform X2 [Branchiostoma floridae]|uniref:Transmembrane protein 183B-like isoform X1 n=1 Tax=Branchiostoma floridae TaxID=7739 RepID=A0A9J7MY83_BRAFL|nr:transmembrane protein 183B-like isoform X1 [Branchiostoma floridae]XP_035683211.1 transmembrane protein 183B-like isoform X2 [Branchiostoma floridae]
MPKRGKKTRRRRAKLAGPDADVTLQQFADAGGSQPPSGRVGKGEGNAFVRQAKALCHGQPSETLKMEEEVPWYEKDWDSDQEESHVDSDTEENLITSNQVYSRYDSQTHDDAEPEVEYPMDIWSMLAPYIRPEDIGRFAAICRNTWLLTRTIGFWRRLYNRYYLSTAQLPERLQRECMERTVCLRTCVIRSLFHLYAPFQLQVNTRAPVDQERFNGIIGSRCMYSWCSKGRTCLTTQSGIRDVWVFYFKLQLPGNLPGGAYHPRRRKLWDVDEDNDDALLNPEDGYCVLRIVAPHFIAVPGTVMGKVMADIKLALSGNMQNHCIMMHFSDQLCTTRKKMKAANASNRARTKANCSTMLGERVILDPVKSIQVLHWWHPQYPYKYPG